MKKAIVVIILIALAAGGVYYYRTKKKKPEDKQKKDQIVTVQRGPIALIVSSTGRVVSNKDVDIKCKASGEVTKLPYDVSDTVKKGDLVLQLDPVDENRNVRNAEVSLQASLSRLKKAQQSYDVASQELDTASDTAYIAMKAAALRAGDAKSKEERMKALLEKQLVSEEDYETALNTALQAQADYEKSIVNVNDLKVQKTALELKRQDITLAQVDVESSRIQRDLMLQRLADTQVYAPMDGVITQRPVQTGQIISSGISNVGGGTTVLTISDLSRLFVLANVDESDIGRIQKDQMVRITADAYPDKMFRGKVVSVAQKGVSTSNVVTFEVKIEVDGRDKDLLKPEMTANVDIIAARNRAALLVPQQAITRSPRGHTVKVVGPGGKKEDRVVELGIDNGEMAEITSGLKEGDRVLVSGSEQPSAWRRDGDQKGQGGPGGQGGSGGRGGQNNPRRMMRMMH